MLSQQTTGSLVGQTLDAFAGHLSVVIDAPLPGLQIHGTRLRAEAPYLLTTEMAHLVAGSAASGPFADERMEEWEPPAQDGFIWIAAARPWTLAWSIQKTDLVVLLDAACVLLVDLNTRPYDWDTVPHVVGSKNVAWFVYLRAFWALSRQPIVGSTKPVRGPRHAARRAERQGLCPDVQVVKLRRYASTRPERGGGTPLTSRHWVGGHWKRQHYGPDRASWYWCYVHKYLRGPDDRPAPADRVYAVIR